MSNDKCNEDFYLIVLLATGCDPEPDNPSATDEWIEWEAATRRFAVASGVVEYYFDNWYEGYFDWLANKGMAYDYRQNP